MKQEKAEFGGIWWKVGGIWWKVGEKRLGRLQVDTMHK